MFINNKFAIGFRTESLLAIFYPIFNVCSEKTHLGNIGNLKWLSQIPMLVDDDIIPGNSSFAIILFGGIGQAL